MTEPTPIGELITQLAVAYDPQLEADAAQIRAFIQGALAGTAMANLPMVRIATVETPVDDKGDYRPYFVIVTENGHRIRVTLSVERPFDAE